MNIITKAKEYKYSITLGFIAQIKAKYTANKI